MHEPRSRRSELATPASSERMCEKAATSGADLVFLDLEDACAPIAKESARATAVAALHRPRLGQDRAGRPGQRPRHAVVPRRHHRGRLGARRVARRAHRAEGAIGPRRLVGRCAADPARDEARPPTKRIGLEVLIEEAEGLANAAEIARASDRLEAIIFGAGDLSASLRARVDGNFDPVGDYPGDFWHFARVQILAAARARASTPSTRRTPPTRTPTGTGGRRHTPACSASTASGPSTPTRSPSPTRCSRRPPSEVAERRGAGRDVPGVRGRRRRRHRAGRQARRRRPHAPGRERALQGLAAAARVTETRFPKYGRLVLVSRPHRG